MAASDLEDIIKKVDALSTDERLSLMSYLAQKSQSTDLDITPGRMWGEIAGTAPYPLVEEDAQTWVSRTRREGDERRAQQWEVSRER